MVLITIYYEQSRKKSQHTNVVQNVAIYVYQKNFHYICADPDTLLKKTTKLISKYRHINKC